MIKMWDREFAHGEWGVAGQELAGVDLPGILHDLAVMMSQACNVDGVVVNLRMSDGDYAVVADTGACSLGSRTTEAFWHSLFEDWRRAGSPRRISLGHVRPDIAWFPAVRLAVPDLVPTHLPDGWNPYNKVVVCLRSRDGSPIGYLCIDVPVERMPPISKLVTDIEAFARHMALAVDLSRGEERLRSLVYAIADIIVLLDRRGVIRYVSPCVERLLGRGTSRWVGSLVFNSGLIHTEDIAGMQDAFAELSATPDSGKRVEFRLRHRDGAWRHFEANVRNLLEDPNVGRVVVNLRDITDHKQWEERLRHQAFHDLLTGLPNRTLFMERLERALLRATRCQRSISVLYLDADGFKRVNDSLGHEAGDLLLIAIGRRLQACLRPEDTAARLGGDEFTVLLEDINDLGEVESVAERIEDALQAPFEVAGHDLRITISIGSALSSTANSDPAELIRAADTAMYRAKSIGRRSTQHS